MLKPMICHILSSHEHEMYLLEPKKRVIFCSNTINSPLVHGLYREILETSFS